MRSATPSTRATTFTPWGGAQVAVLLGTAATVVSAMVWPRPVLGVFWNLALPLLPLTFLVSPVLWRAVCPLATLNMVAAGPGGRSLPGTLSRWSGWPSMLALLVIVPARPVVFNDSGPAFAGLIVVSALLAVGLGMVYRARAGFCNLLCPVLPVERLYGQQPLVDVGNPRCPACSVCTPRGCPDLAGEKTLPQLLGTYRREVQWVATATGVFACAFPGFILGYFLMPAGSDPGPAYASVVGGAAASLLIGAALSYTFRVPSTRALPLLASLAAALYLWFASRGALATVGLDKAPWLVLVRVICLVAVSLWWWRARQAQPPVRRTALPLLTRE